MTTTEPLKPGTPVLVEAVAEKGRDHPWLLVTPGGDEGPWQWLDPAKVRWHHDNRAALAAVHELRKTERDEAQERARQLAQENWRLINNRDADRFAYDRGCHTAAEELNTLRAERDEAQAQVAAMLPVVEAAETLISEVERLAAHYESVAVSSFVEDFARRVGVRLRAASDAYRVSQKAPAEALRAPSGDQEATVVVAEAKGSTGTTGGRTGGEPVCSADGNAPCPIGTPNCPPGYPANPGPLTCEPTESRTVCAHCGCDEDKIGGGSCLRTNDCPTVIDTIEASHRAEGWRDPDCPAAYDKNARCICAETDPAEKADSHIRRDLATWAYACPQCFDVIPGWTSEAHAEDAYEWHMAELHGKVTAKRKPRTWRSGDPEPGPEVTAVRDVDGDLDGNR